MVIHYHDIYIYIYIYIWRNIDAESIPYDADTSSTKYGDHDVSSCTYCNKNVLMLLLTNLEKHIINRG